MACCLRDWGIFFNTSTWTCWGTVGAAAHPGIEPGGRCGAKLAPGLGCIEKVGGQKKGGIGGGNGYMAGPGPMGIGGRKGFGGLLGTGTEGGCATKEDAAACAKAT